MQKIEKTRIANIHEAAEKVAHHRVPLESQKLRVLCGGLFGWMSAAGNELDSYAADTALDSLALQ
jgi:hypothetical protein